MAETSVIQQILDVLTAIAGWLVESVNDVVTIFYTTEDGITVLGTLAIIGFGVGLVYGLLKFITGFASGRR